MSRTSFGQVGSRVQRQTKATTPTQQRSAAEVVRELKQGQQKPKGEDYRQRSLALHGTVCARCGREFAGKNLRLLTVHHKDGNHHNNPADGSNWENLCVYCHDHEHSSDLHGDHIAGSRSGDTRPVVYQDEAEEQDSGGGGLGDLLRKAMEKKGGGK